MTSSAGSLSVLLVTLKARKSLKRGRFLGSCLSSISRRGTSSSTTLQAMSAMLNARDAALGTGIALTTEVDEGTTST
jgi:hypothetical protein